MTKCSMQKKIESVAKKREGLSPKLQARADAKKNKQAMLAKLKELDDWKSFNTTNLFCDEEFFADYYPEELNGSEVIGWYWPIVKGVTPKDKKRAQDIAKRALADYDEYVDVCPDYNAWDDCSGFGLHFKPEFYALPLEDMKEVIAMLDEDVGQWPRPLA